jgi:hypothetical protein
VNHGDGEERIEAGDETFPAHHQATVLPLEPRKCALSVKAWDVLFEGAPTRLSGLPGSFRNLRSDSTAPEAMTESLGVVPFIRREDLEPLARSGAPPAGRGPARVRQAGAPPETPAGHHDRQRR